MHRISMLLAVFGLVIVLLNGCESSSTKDRITQLQRDNNIVHTKYTGLLERYKTRLSDLKRENDLLKNKNHYDAEKKVLRNELGDIPGLQERDGELIVVMAADILFDPGKAILKASAKDTLFRLARALKDPLFEGKPIRIEGHTDADPIKRARKQYKNNWDLGANRALSVLDFLTKKGGLSPAKRTIYTASFSHYHPVASNSNKRGKSKNRRVEVVVIMGK